MKTAVFFLTREKIPDGFSFPSSALNHAGIGAWVVADDSSMDADCHKYGFINAMYSNGITHIQKNPVSLDKALMLLCREHDYDFALLLEDDCFVPSVDAIKNLIDKYQGNDLVIRDHKPKTTPSLEWHWKNIDAAKIPRPWYSSLASAVGLSRAMLNAIHNQATVYKTLFYHEIMFSTLAQHHGLKICNPQEFKTVVWQGAWGIDDFMSLPLNVFHPVKGNHATIKYLISQAVNHNYEPVDKLPNFAKQNEE